MKVFIKYDFDMLFIKASELEMLNCFKGASFYDRRFNLIGYSILDKDWVIRSITCQNGIEVVEVDDLIECDNLIEWTSLFTPVADPFVSDNLKKQYKSKYFLLI